MRRQIAGLTLSLAILAHTASAERIRLARDGKPVATIVIPARASERATQAAAELQRYVAAVCGVELPVRRDGRRVEGTGLYIGRCEPSREGDPPAARLNPESYAIRVRDGSIFFAGRYPTPTYFAVVSFIEDVLGVRWFAPGEAWESVPRGTPGELTVEVREVVKAPDTSPRLWSGHNFAPSWERWNLLNKVVCGEVIPRRQFQNNLHTVFPPSKYARAHPEYYPLIDGRRWIPEPGDRYWRPCESNPDVIRITVEFARRWFDEHPTIDSFSVGMDDITHLCGCPNCRALDPRPDSYEKREFSDRHYTFVNTIAREIAKTHPDRYVGTLIYAIARKPPETVPRLEDNVFGFLTEECASWWQPGEMDADHALTREWARRCRHLSRYDYVGLGTFTPRYYPHWMAEQIRFDKSLGLEGMYTELNTFLPHTAPMVWALAKLEWNASLDMDALLNEFFAKMFGPAAATVARYYDGLEKSWNTPRPGRTEWVHRNIVAQAASISPEAVDEGLALLDEAARQADTDAIRGRIDTIRAALQYASYAIRVYPLSQSLLTAPVRNATEADRAADAAKRVLRLSAERGPFWAAAMQRDDLLGENLRGLAAKAYLMIGKTPELEKGGSLGAIRALTWYADNAPDRLPAVAAGLTGSFEGGAADLIRAWLWVRENKPPNLLQNPGFEDTPSPTASRRRDSHAAVLPAHWSAVAEGAGPPLSSRAGQGRNGTAAVGTSGARGTPVCLQAHEVRPGERFYCSAYANNLPADREARGFLSVRFQTAAGAWNPHREAEPQVFTVAQPGWQPLMFVVTVPKDAARLIVMVGAKNQPPDATVLFDDVALYRLPP